VAGVLNTENRIRCRGRQSGSHDRNSGFPCRGHVQVHPVWPDC